MADMSQNLADNSFNIRDGGSIAGSTFPLKGK